MSIFKQTLADTIQTQLAARALVVTGATTGSIARINQSTIENRNPLLPWYLSKNSWVRMTSLVDYTSGKVDFGNPSNPNSPFRNGKIQVIPNGWWEGDQLAKRYILEGGTLYTKTNNMEIEAALRKNVATVDGAYGGNFDVMGNGLGDPGYSRLFGIRPMPGITSVNMHTVGAYGSIFETTVKFYAWDTKQLNDLEILFMRPGYSVLLEWGWSQYINYTDKLQDQKQKIKTDDITSQVFDGRTINAFDKSNTIQDIYNKLQTLRVKNKHNYDGMLGYVKNFQWKMMPGGGYDCTTTLISMGEVINSLKISTNNLAPTKPSFNFDLTKKVDYVFDDYENILLSLKAAGEGLTKYAYLSGSWRIDENDYRGAWDFEKNYVNRNSIAKTLKSNNHTFEADRLLNKQPFTKKISIANPDDPKPEGDDYEYISLDVLMAIMDSYFNIQVLAKGQTPDPNNIKKMVKIIPPGAADYCLAGPDSVSVDPSVCLISNPLAFQKEFVKGLNPTIQNPGETNGVTPPVKQTVIEKDGNYQSDEFTYLEDFYIPTNKVGLIGNIYVNLSFLLAEYKSIKNSANDEGVNFITYMKNILSKISNSLGGLNNFILSTAGRDQNTLRIVDTYYLENDSNGKYKFDLVGLGSICREVDVQSEIFPEQSTIIAIAAQSRANLGDIYNSTQVYLNAGIEDRLAQEKYQPGEDTINLTPGDPNNAFYQKLFDFLIYLRNNVVGTGNDFIIDTQNTGTVPYNFLKQFMLRYNGELGFKALIPFKLTIKLDGISGIIVGEVFQIEQNVLPRNYYDKNLGFIITRISHDLVKNDWETTLETQICLLDHITLGDNYLKHNRQGFIKFLSIAVKDAILYPALISFIEYQATRAFLILLYDLTFGREIKLSSPKEIELDQNATSFPLTYAIEYLSNKGTKREFIKDLGAIWKEDVFVALNSPYNTDLPSNKGINVDYKVDQFAGYFQEWVKKYKAQNSQYLNVKINDDETLGQALDSIISEPYYSETLLPISEKISQNIDILTDPNTIWNGVFSKYLPNASVPNLFDHKQLQNNIENALVNKNIITNTVKQSYYLLPFNEEYDQLKVNPINTAVSFDGSDSMFYRLKLRFENTNPSNVYEPGAYYGDIFIQSNSSLNPKNIVQSYFSDFYKGNVSIGNRTDAIFEDKKIQEFLKNENLFK